MTIKAIQTFYKGYHFRSRLEARWAVFFDTLGIKYQYEIEGFEKEDRYRPGYISKIYYEKDSKGNNIDILDADIEPYKFYYLPDFYLPETKTWVEVKGDPTALCERSDEFNAMLDFDSILPHFSDSEGTNQGLMLLGEIPDGYNYHTYVHPIIQHHEGLYKNWCKFESKSPFLKVYDGGCNCLWYPKDWVIETKCIDERMDYHVSMAYKAARAMRFEKWDRKDGINTIYEAIC